jgi:hypothetical protein
MADPIARAISTYGALKGMEFQQQQADRLNRLDEERAEDRTFQRGMLEKQEARTDENDAWIRTQRARQVEEWSEADIKSAREQSDQVLLEFTGQMRTAGKQEWGPEEVGELMSRLEPVKHGLRRKLAALYDSKSVAERKSATQGVLKQLYTGRFEHGELLKDANLAFADELDARGQKYGAKQVRFARLVPSPQGDGFMAELEITKGDGSKYRAPATVNGGTAEDGDDEVKVYRMEEVAPYLVGQLQTLQGAETYLKSRGKLQEPKQEWVFGADGELRMNKFSGETEKTGYVKPDKDGSGGGGKGVKSHLYDEFNQTLLRSLVADYGIDDGDFGVDAMGNQRVDVDRFVNKLPKAAQQRYLQALREGERLMVDEGLSPIRAAQQALGPADAFAVPDPEILAQAEEIARKEARNKAGWVSSDSADFEASGGSREGFIAERTNYWVRKLSGQEEDSPPKGGMASPGRDQRVLTKENPDHVALARKFLQQAGGDKAKARELAKKAGYSF